MRVSRRYLLSRLFFYGTPVAGLGYASGIEKRFLRLTEVEVPVGARHAALDGLKVGLMSDFHHDDFGDARLIRRAVDAMNRRGADLVVLAGDYISRDPAAIGPLCAELARLRPRLGTYAVMGNHDRWHYDDAMPGMFREAGLRLLVNEAVTLDGFAVAGADSHWGGLPDIASALREVRPDTPVLLAWHEPDTFDGYDDSRVALQVSGHTHGGQVRVPFYGPIVLPNHGKKYPYGLYRRGERSLFVTRGIGTLTLPVRFFCPPEAALLTLRAEA